MKAPKFLQRKTLSLSKPNKLSFFTVTYSDEIPLLKLQSRSMARYLDPACVHEIVVAVNDIDEAAVAEVCKTETEYGPLQEKVRFVGRKDLFKGAVRSIFARLKLKAAVEPKRSGWQIQQAMKLACARLLESEHVIILDTKDVLLRDFVLSDYFTSNGLARHNLGPIQGKRKRWFNPSCRALWTLPYFYKNGEVTSFITPFPIQRSLLLQVLEAVEFLHGPVGSFFSEDRIRATEFMLINAYCYKAFGGVSDVFTYSSPSKAMVYMSSKSNVADDLIDAIQLAKYNWAGLHAAGIGRLTPEQKSSLERALTSAGLTFSDEEAGEILEDLACRNRSRINASWARVTTA